MYRGGASTVLEWAVALFIFALALWAGVQLIQAVWVWLAGITVVVCTVTGLIYLLFIRPRRW